MLQYIVLGIIQGITEFLPVSSSGHLVVMQKILGLSSNELALSVILHLGTTLSVAVFFFQDIVKALRNLKLLSLITIVTLITAVIGLSAKDFFESLFSSVYHVGLALIFTGAVLLLTKRFKATKNSLSIKDACVLGFAQALAIIPGVSRSGVTISTLLFRRIDPEVSFKFSFLISIPAVLGAALIEAKKINFAFQGETINFIAGFVFSFLTGILALAILKRILLKARLFYFGYYCFAIAAIILIFLR